MQDNMVARLQSTYKRVQPPLSPSLLNVMYCVRVSLRIVKKYSLRNTKEKEVVGNLYISLG
jgi:hypothetical protein